MVDSYIKLRTAFLYGQSPPSSPSSLGASSTPGIAAMPEEALTPTRFRMLSINAFCVISHAPRSLSCRKAQQVYQVSSTGIFVGNNRNLRDMEISACLFRSCDHYVSYIYGRDQLNLAVHNYATHTSQTFTAPYRSLPQSLQIIRPTAGRSGFDHAAICSGGRPFLIYHHVHQVVSHIYIYLVVGCRANRTLCDV